MLVAIKRCNLSTYYHLIYNKSTDFNQNNKINRNIDNKEKWCYTFIVMKITVLAENTAKTNNFLAEHGLSLLIDSNGKNILFDCGQTDAFIKNAKTLGVDLSCVDFLVLSHGHYDHGGGLNDFLKINKTAKVYLSKNAFDKHYNGREKYIGLSPVLYDKERIVIVDNDLKIADDIVIKRLTKEPFKIDSAGLTVNVDGEFLPDDFEHEQYLSIIENDIEYLFSGCTHKGLDNDLDQLNMPLSFR